MILCFLAARLVEAESAAAKAKRMFKLSKEPQFKGALEYWSNVCAGLKWAIARIPQAQIHPKFIPES